MTKREAGKGWGGAEHEEDRGRRKIGVRRVEERGEQ